MGTEGVMSEFSRIAVCDSARLGGGGAASPPANLFGAKEAGAALMVRPLGKQAPPAPAPADSAWESGGVVTCNPPNPVLSAHVTASES